MAHNQRCENAKSKRSRCRCACRGARHGLVLREEFAAGEEQVITADMGGEIAAFFKRIEGKQFAPGYGTCVHDPPLNQWLGYPHDGGLADAKGNRWWVYLTCDECHYDASWWKVENRLGIGENLIFGREVA